MISYGSTDKGNVRKNNQDYIFFSDKPVGHFPNLYIVADGMGGHKAGEVASKMAADLFVQYATEEKEDSLFLMMKRIVNKVNKRIYDEASSNIKYKGMGTTLIAATIDTDKVYLVNIGDSRLYHYNGSIKQITTDHTYVQYLLSIGEITQEEVDDHPKGHIITRAVGIEEDITPDYFDINNFEKGNRLMLCSDGLYKMVKEDDIKTFLSLDLSEKDIVSLLIDEALHNGGKDNISVIVVRNGRR